MKIELVRPSKFSAVVRKFATGTTLGPTPVLAGHEPNDPLAILLTNYLLWESTPTQAEEALEKIARVVVDVNELRVMLEREVVETIGEKYPFVEERARRLRATFNDIFRRQHRTSLDHLRGLSRKDQRAYVEGLAEIPPFVAGRTLLVAFENPAPIIDDTSVELLHREGAVDGTATTAEVAAWIGKNHRQEELPRVHFALEAMNRNALKSSVKQGVKEAMKLREAYLARHDGFRAAIEAERAKEEAAKREAIEAEARAVEARRLEEIAREEERIRQKREAEEARVRAKFEREAARVAAIAKREADRIAREEAKVRAEQERVQKQLEREALARKRAEEAQKRREQLEAERRKKAEIAQKLAEKKAALAKKLALKKAEQAKKLAAKKAEQAKKLAAKKALAEAKKAQAKKAQLEKAQREKAAREKVKALALKQAAIAKQLAAKKKAALKQKPAKMSSKVSTKPVVRATSKRPAVAATSKSTSKSSSKVSKSSKPAKASKPSKPPKPSKSSGQSRPVARTAVKSRGRRR